ncbi:MAG TPA: fasciclin domain-containing protein [Pseudomonadota bacterium]|nr:fasciclin domain-containing protein [Pseudomonadota bacterium]
MKSRLNVLYSLSVSAALLAGCGDPKDDVPATPDLATAPDLGVSARKDLVDTAIGAGQFTTLVAAVQGAGLEQTLRGPGPFTVFAPTDDAFQKVPAFLLSKLVTPPYKTELGLILKYHVLAGQVKAADVLGKKQDVASLQGASLNVDGSGGKVVLNGSINVTKPDVLGKNGVIHVIDGVLLPTLVDTAIGYDDGTAKFSTLVAAVKAAGLVDTLNGPGPFTIFAPTDAAFAALKTALGDAAFDALLANKAKLTRVLTYHVLAAAAYQKDIASGAVTTVETGKLNVTVANSKVTIADSTATAANVVFTDVPGRNGVIHVIDKVLIPPGL